MFIVNTILEETIYLSGFLDLEAPIISLNENITVDCEKCETCNVSPERSGYPNVTDNFSKNISLNYSDEHQGLCLINRTWIAQDESKNVRSRFQLIFKKEKFEVCQGHRFYKS